MIIKYKNYSNGVHLITEKEKAVQLGLPENYKGDVNISCKMDKSIHQIVLNCEVECEADLTCDRCNTEFASNIKNNFLVTCFFEEEDRDDDHINIKFLSIDQDKIDLREEICEYLLLAVPMKNLCNEDCKGLCVSCGINLNEASCNCSQAETDSVWEPLKKLKDNLNN